MANKTPSAGSPLVGQTLQDLYESVAGQLARGKSPRALIDQLVARGWPQPTAQQFVANAGYKSTLYKALTAERTCTVQQYKRQALRGVLLSLLGIGIVVLSMSVPSMALGFCQFALGVGLCIVGSLDMSAGLSGWRRNR
jgi:hypothetical protein